MDRDPEEQRPSILREIAVVALFALVVLYLTACAAPAPVPAFPADMRLICHEGTYHVASVSADQIVRLPLKCT